MAAKVLSVFPKLTAAEMDPSLVDQLRTLYPRFAPAAAGAK